MESHALSLSLWSLSLSSPERRKNERWKEGVIPRGSIYTHIHMFLDTHTHTHTKHVSSPVCETQIDSRENVFAATFVYVCFYVYRYVCMCVLESASVSLCCFLYVARTHNV